MSVKLPVTDAYLASCCGMIYDPLALAKFDLFDGGLDDGVCWAILRLDGLDILVFRGSVTPLDWLHDFRAFSVHTRVGEVHRGFWSGMESAWRKVRPQLRQPFAITGHSLGAAHADMATAQAVLDGVPPVARVVFGEPRPGMDDFAKIVATVPGRSYRNGDALHHDLVTDVPVELRCLKYTRPTALIPVCERPGEDVLDQLGIFSWHHMPLYQAAVFAHEQAVTQAA